MAKRKKDSTRSGLLAKTRALTPPNAIRQGEIVEEIVDHLRPWKARKDNSEITLVVNRELRFLLALAPLAANRSDRTDNRTHAQKLDVALLNVEKLLDSAPSALQRHLWNPITEQDIESANRKRADSVNSFTTELKRLREICAHAIDPGFGHHQNYNLVTFLCAQCAYDLMQDVSNRKITGTKDDAFRAIASLLYEAASGQHDADLKRACDFVLRTNRGPNKLSFDNVTNAMLRSPLKEILS